MLSIALRKVEGEIRRLCEAMTIHSKPTLSKLGGWEALGERSEHGMQADAILNAGCDVNADGDSHTSHTRRIRSKGPRRKVGGSVQAEPAAI
jgi:hypothetical protein